MTVRAETMPAEWHSPVQVGYLETPMGWMVGIGLTIGVAISMWAGKFVDSMLYGLQPRDTLTLVTAATTLAIVALLAGWLPARRASRIDPTVVLRES